nr:hypothetical protein KPHV_60590 [Kitasatospora purpeofusca]
MHIDLARLRPAYNGAALAAGALAAPYWAAVLTDIAHTGDGTGPLGATVIAAGLTAAADRARPGLWLPRAALATTLIAPALSTTAARPVLAFLTGVTL